MDILREYIQILRPYLPIGIVGLVRWLIWSAKKAISLSYRPIFPQKDRMSISVVSAIYNENPIVFMKALQSWKKINPLEIIAVIDYTDLESIKIFNKFCETFGGGRLIMGYKPGKRPSLAKGIKAAKGEIVILADSDTIWNKMPKSKILAPFQDESVGGVTVRQEVLKPDTLAKKLYNIQLSDRYFTEYPFLSAANDYLNCLSGRTSLYRRKALLEAVDEMENETFWGRQSISGEDKALTSSIQKRGWKTRYVAEACVKTYGPPDFMTLLKQRIRWARNSWRADIKTVFKGEWVWRRSKVLAFYTLDRFIQPFLSMLAPAYFAYSLWTHNWLAAELIGGWWLASRLVKNISHFKRHPSDLLILPIYILNSFFLNGIKIYALFTIRTQGWITRWNEDRLPKLSLIKSIPAFLAVISVFSLALLAAFELHPEGTVEEKPDPLALLSSNKKADKSFILENINNNQFGYYYLKPGEILFSVARRYNFETANAAKKDGNRIAIPISDLRNSPREIIYYNTPEIYYIPDNKTIYIKGEGSYITLPILYGMLLENKNLLEPLENKEWILRANILAAKGVNFSVSERDVSWLKVKSDSEGFFWIRAENGNIGIYNTLITSWDENKNSPDFEIKDGRSYILAKGNSRLDISGSELAFLGYDGPKGSCGLSWMGKEEGSLAVGGAKNSFFHNNFAGLCFFGSTGISLEKNEINNNYSDGIFFGDLSNNSLIFNNEIYSNEEDGVIISDGSYNNILISNNIFENKSNGVSLADDSKNNLVETNKISRNTCGIIISRSNQNLVQNNSISNNKQGISLKENSFNSYFENNSIERNEEGVWVYGEPEDNYLADNSISNNKINIKL